MKGRLSVLLALVEMLVVMLVLAGVALAATIDCVAGQQCCTGTQEDDTLHGTTTTDLMEDLEGDEELHARRYSLG